MMQIPGAVLVRFEACLEVARSNLNKIGICLSLTYLLFAQTWAQPDFKLRLFALIGHNIVRHDA